MNLKHQHSNNLNNFMAFTTLFINYFEMLLLSLLLHYFELHNCITIYSQAYFKNIFSFEHVVIHIYFHIFHMDHCCLYFNTNCFNCFGLNSQQLPPGLQMFFLLCLLQVSLDQLYKILNDQHSALNLKNLVNKHFHDNFTID